MDSIISVEQIVKRIFVIRGEKVMLDSDLAELYEVPTGALNQAVKRNVKRFPEDFMFQLTNEEVGLLRSQMATSRQGQKFSEENQEVTNLRSQFVISSFEYGGRRYLPFAFTERGVAMELDKGLGTTDP